MAIFRDEYHCPSLPDCRRTYSISANRINADRGTIVMMTAALSDARHTQRSRRSAQRSTAGPNRSPRSPSATGTAMGRMSAIVTVTSR
jgi:hypothetical protein